MPIISDMANPFKVPDKQLIYQFVVSTHQVEKIPVTTGDVNDIYTHNPKEGWKKIPNPYALGTLKALGLIFRSIDQDNFPVPNTISTLQESHDALTWVRNIHKLMHEPLLNNPITESDYNVPKLDELGNYRQKPDFLMDHEAPYPRLIPKILYTWSKELSDLHSNLKDKAKIPYGLSKKEADSLAVFSYQTTLLFSSTLPFTQSNNRVGRLIELALRLQWRFPIKIYSDPVYQNFTRDLTAFQKEKLQSIVYNAHHLKT